VVFQLYLPVLEVNKHKLWLGLQLSNFVLFICIENKTGVNKFYKKISNNVYMGTDFKPIPVAARSEAWACGHSQVRIPLRAWM